MKVYTRRGDKGETDLAGGGRVSKDALRVEAYGAVDELNAALSLARAEEISGWMQRHLGLTKDQFSVAGEGSSMPLSEDPARNRRVEVRWVPAMQ